LRSLGIEDVRARRGLAGSYVLEVPGLTKEDRGSKAVALAAEMRGVFAEDLSVRIDRPSAAIRVRGIDEAVTAEEVVAAIADRGVAKHEEIKVSISRPANGMGVALVRCPVRAADDLVTAARLRIGWTSARVELAVARPSYCFKCWGEGHVAARCSNAEDRSRICYRCGTAGHTASSCRAAPRCLPCAEAGKRADHRMGGAGCERFLGRAPPVSSAPQQRQRQRQQKHQQGQQQQLREAPQQPRPEPLPKKQRPTRERTVRRDSEKMGAEEADG